MKATASIDIERPIDEVFAYVSDLRNMDSWVTGVSDAKLVSGEPDEVGAQYESNYTYGGRTVPMTYEVTGVDEPTRLTMHGDEPFEFDGELTLVPVGDGTRVTNTIDAQADGRATAFIFSLLGPLMRRRMTQRLDEELEALKEAVEGSPVARAA